MLSPTHFCGVEGSELGHSPRVKHSVAADTKQIYRTHIHVCLHVCMTNIAFGYPNHIPILTICACCEVFPMCELCDRTSYDMLNSISE